MQPYVLAEDNATIRLQFTQGALEPHSVHLRVLHKVVPDNLLQLQNRKSSSVPMRAANCS